MEPPGGSIDHPASEEEDLREEQYLYPQGDKGGCKSGRCWRVQNSPTRLLLWSVRARVLSSFKVLSAGKLVHIDATSLHRQDFSAFEVVGIAATIHGVEGLFSQSAWFGGNDLDWFWARLPKISRIEVREDVRFRGG